MAVQVSLLLAACLSNSASLLGFYLLEIPTVTLAITNSAASFSENSLQERFAYRQLLYSFVRVAQRRLPDCPWRRWRHDPIYARLVAESYLSPMRLQQMRANALRDLSLLVLRVVRLARLFCLLDMTNHDLQYKRP